MPSHAPPPPDSAAASSARCSPVAAEFVARLASDGVTRGLIGPREVPRLWERHMLNSAAVAEAVPQGARVVDVGSGAGLPGIPLGIARPDLDLILLEPMARRVEFLEEVVAGLAAPAGLRWRVVRGPRRGAVGRQGRRPGRRGHRPRRRAAPPARRLVPRA